MNFLHIILILAVIPIANIILFVPVLMKYGLTEIRDLLLLFSIEVILSLFVFFAPIMDGGIFIQGFLVELIGGILLWMQVSVLMKSKRKKSKN